MNIILPISRLPLFTTCLDIYIHIYIYIYISKTNISCTQFSFLRKNETQKKSEGKGRRTQICFVSANLHDAPFFENSQEVDTIFCLSKYDYDNNRKLQLVGFLRNGVLQVLTSWENQTVLRCLKHHRIHVFRFHQ